MNALQRVPSPGSWDDALTSLSTLGEFIRRRPVLEEASALLTQAEPCLTLIENLLSGLARDVSRPLLQVVRSMQGAIYRYVDFESDSADAGPPSQAYRKRRAEERDELWQQMLKALDATIDVVATRAATG
jgi:hypothetical protein